MKLPTQSALASLILALNWYGHVELPVGDVNWLAGEILRLLTPATASERCEACNRAELNFIRTRIGIICWSCIEGFNEDMEETKEDWGG